ncbi:WD40 repeat domain-containing protein [Pectobacterium polonicum]|uniref:WD40 repeat domain-containing protein n=1 Tax=Pectobacterium polonicum TaxID=2485124 RepID=A0ABV1PFC7_9GAMM|nr:WD40 repeat domain-containing protein [Pectobacterium polonicum]MDC9821104.1 WD40 repeat domain-containing protein [Pectobacterium polonicum]
MYKHTAPISGIATAQNKWILTAGYDNRVILWDADTKSPINRVFHDHLVNQCTFSPCGNFIATVSSDYSCRIWSFPEMGLTGIIKSHKDDVESAAFHPEENLIATCSRDKTIIISDFQGNTKHHLKGHKADVISVEWSANNNLISSSDDGTIRVWNSQTGEEVECIDLDEVETDTIVIASCGTIYAGNDNGEIITISQGKIKTTPAHEAGIKRLIYDNNREVIVSLSYDRKMKLWRRYDGGLENYHTTDLPSIVWPRSCAFLDEDNLVFASFGDSYAQYNISEKKWQLAHIKPTHGLNAVQLLNGKLWSVGDAGTVFCEENNVAEMGSLCNFLCEFKGALLTGGQMGTLFDARTGEVIYQHHSPLNCAYSSSGDNSLCVVGSYTGEGIILREVNNRIQVTDIVSLHQNAIKGVALSDSLIFSVCADSAAAFHKISDLSCHKYIPKAHDKIANGCDGTDSGTFVSISRDLKLRVWNDEKATVIETPSQNSIKCVALSKNNKYIAIGNYTGWVGIYDLTSERWSYWQRRSFSGISSIKSTADNFVFSTYEGICEYVISE